MKESIIFVQVYPQSFILFFLTTFTGFSLFLSTTLVKGQSSFRGSFIMTVNSPAEESQESPMLWNIESAGNGGIMAMEIQDEMRKKGVSKRVLFNPKDSTWTMLMSLNNIKQGSRIHRAEMFRKKAAKQKLKISQTTSTKLIEGFNCKKVFAESANYKAELWITNELNFDVCGIYKLLSHCGMINDYVRKGEWYNAQLKGMVLEVRSTKKATGEFYSMHISSLKKNGIDPLLFNTKGFMISEIPEGQNCGVPMEEK